ncbi:hypothetical protein GCM10011583_11930 [Streptomyces camponoticapitis]|uniref:Uncharacterized protein n=1 Tax=Streptomyces camponoticapitis TaxID=1616125 RepID=A0ABQ2E075_9ACTN|nr:hypothetical protein [Streptomyces camponoticapitis]GGJ82014.1 hypothetical protein GCM10011583_11930 [Streptomyces camponoticapitis]
MSVEIKFTNREDDQRYEDGEGREYRYTAEGSGALSIYEKEDGETIGKEAVPIAVYGPTAWFSVTGDPVGRADRPVPRLR